MELYVTKDNHFFSTRLKKNTVHSYHIVNPSPWPVIVSFAAFATVLGLALFMHFFTLGFKLFLFGIITTTFNVVFWWRDVVREGTFEGHHTFVVQNGLRFGMILFIVSEIRLFFAFFWAFFHASLNPTPSIGAEWPPKGIEAMNPWLIPLLLLTLVFATLFTILQVYEYINASFTIADGVYGSTFYMLTGLHGFHVVVGTIFLMVSLYRVARHHYTTTNHIGYESAAWYWHFVDVVWIFLFLAVYIWGDSFETL